MIRTFAAVLTWLSLVAVTVVAGGHAVYYLLEWEWVRAQIAGIAFVGGLVIGATLLVLARIRAVERQLAGLAAAIAAGAAGSPWPGAASGGPAPAAGLPDPEPRPDLPWLSSAPRVALLAPLALVGLEAPRGGVFIPVFLATGLAVSAVAAAVERLAALRRPAAASGVPNGTAPLLGPRTSRSQRPVTPRRRPSVVPLVVVPLAGVLGIAGVIGALWLGAHYWAQPMGPGTTTLTVQVRTNGPTTNDADVLETMGRYCVLNSGVTVRFDAVAPGPGDTVLLRLNPQLDSDATRRFSGCLEDAIMERHQLEVVGVDVEARAR